MSMPTALPSLGRFLLTGFLLVTVCALPGRSQPADAASAVRVGVIGLDTSHSPAFTRILNASEPEARFAGYRVVAAYPNGSTEIESSRARIPEYTEQVRALGVEIVDSIAELLDRVDVVLLETNDGGPHLAQAREVILAGKPLFVDKPVAADLADVYQIYRLAASHGVPVYSSSSLRFTANAQAVRGGAIGRVVGADAYSPATLEPSHPDLFWYGIHGVELLYTVMGPGCRSVQRIRSDDTEIVVGRWDDGRIGVFRGTRSGTHSYGGTAFGEQGNREIGPYDGYEGLVASIVDFFRSGEPPVSAEETLEIYTFMEAADESKRLGGAEVLLEDIREATLRQLAQ